MTKPAVAPCAVCTGLGFVTAPIPSPEGYARIRAEMQARDAERKELDSARTADLGRALEQWLRTTPPSC